MMRKLFLFCLFLSSLFILSCNNNALKPDDFSKEYINKKYPYWQVSVSRFQISQNEKTYTTITVEEKRYILRGMALLRIVVNSEEFPGAVKSKKDELISGVSDSYNGKTLNVGDKYDPDRVTEIIRTVKYDFIYEKTSANQAGGVGTVGNSRYLRYGIQPEDQIFIGDWVGFVNANWLPWSYNNIGNFAPLMFHEHMHNIGFGHPGAYVLDDIVRQLGYRILSGDLKDKYARQLDELTAYYYTEYKNLLLEDTIFDPSLK